MEIEAPTVSIGLPVCNGQRHVAEAIHSLLSQSYADFELIISDNASNDSTGEICRSFARKDPRVRYERLERNIGAAANFNRVFEIAKGRYFKWAAHDDICLPDFLLECVAALEGDASLILAHSEVAVIGEDGERMASPATLNADLQTAGLQKPERRFSSLMREEHWCIEVFGLIRSAELRETKLIGSYPGSDRVLLAELALRGRFQRIPRLLFLSRDHESRSIKVPIRRRGGWFDPALEGRLMMPFFLAVMGYFAAIGRVQLPLTKRIACLLAVGRWMVLYRGRLITDLRVALRHVRARNFEVPLEHDY